jgi:hypothetical protein
VVRRRKSFAGVGRLCLKGEIVCVRKRRSSSQNEFSIPIQPQRNSLFKFSQNVPLPYPDSLVVRVPQKNVPKIQAQCLCLARREEDVVERWSDDKIAKGSR